MDSEEDVVLIQRCLAGDSSAFEPLVERYHRPLFNLAARLLGNRDEAMDSTQNAFAKAYEHLGSFDQQQRFFSWIYQILRHECFNALRARRPLSELPAELADKGVSPSAALEQDERKAAVQAAVMELSDEQREVVLLRHFTELSYDEIASTLAIPVKTVKSRLYSARQRLAALLADRKLV